MLEHTKSRKIKTLLFSIAFTLLFLPANASAIAFIPVLIIVAIVSAVIPAVRDALLALTGLILNLLMENLTKWNPVIYPLTDAGPLGEMIKEFLKLMIPVYMMAFLLIGIFYIFASETPKNRARAKAMLNRLFLGMVVTTAAPAIFQLLLNISSAMTALIVSNIKEHVGASSTAVLKSYITGFSVLGGPASLILVLFVSISALSAVIMLMFRYLMVSLLAVLFPIVIFLYVFDFTKPLGRMLMKSTIMWIFVPVLAAVWLSLAVFSAAQFEGAGWALIVKTSFLVTAMSLVTISPLIVTGVMETLGGLVGTVGMFVPGPWGFALAAAGGLMQGKGPSALAATALHKGAGANVAKVSKKFKAATGNLASKIGDGIGGPLGKGISASGKKLSGASAGAAGGGAGPTAKGKAGGEGAAAKKPDKLTRDDAEKDLKGGLDDKKEKKSEDRASKEHLASGGGMKQQRKTDVEDMFEL